MTSRFELLSPSRFLWERLAQKISGEKPGKPQSHPRSWSEPDWETVAPGITCKILARDSDRDRVTMLVNLAPGVAYPPHVHHGVEELHLLDGELWIGERRLEPGDYNLGQPGETDVHVWSETGCTCVLITSTRDRLIDAGASPASS